MIIHGSLELSLYLLLFLSLEIIELKVLLAVVEDVLGLVVYDELVVRLVDGRAVTRVMVQSELSRRGAGVLVLLVMRRRVLSREFRWVLIGVLQGHLG